MEKGELDPNLYFGSGEFELPNGDAYDGEYCAHRYGLTWREGHGIYTSKDGQTYEGEWRDDKLVAEQPLTIKFPTGEEYHGALLQEKYSGGGTYTMSNKMDITCEFFDNRPVGPVMLIDINGHIWKGQAGENSALLLPENNFFNSICEDRGIGKPKEKEKKRRTSDEESETAGQPELTNRELEKIIFAKSSKTAHDINFMESKWCQRHLRYMTMKKTISKKLEAGESLTEEEVKWKQKYEKYKEGQKERQKAKKITQNKKSVVDTSLLETYYSKEFQNSCPPIKVIYPTSDWAPDCYLKTDQIELKEDTEKDPEKQMTN